jgi:hypothetical protein
MPKMTSREIKRGFWYETRATVSCLLPPDGLLVIFDLEAVQKILDAAYPSRIRNGEKVWFFNSVHDRECAEQDGDRVYANPQVLYSHFMKGNENGR